MFASIKTSFLLWVSQLQQLVRSEYLDLEPHEYCIGAVFVIAIGFVLLNGRQ